MGIEQVCVCDFCGKSTDYPTPDSYVFEVYATVNGVSHPRYACTRSCLLALLEAAAASLRVVGETATTRRPPVPA